MLILVGSNNQGSALRTQALKGVFVLKEKRAKRKESLRSRVEHLRKLLVRVGLPVGRRRHQAERPRASPPRLGLGLLTRVVCVLPFAESSPDKLRQKGVRMPCYGDAL